MQPTVERSSDGGCPTGREPIWGSRPVGYPPDCRVSRDPVSPSKMIDQLEVTKILGGGEGGRGQGRITKRVRYRLRFYYVITFLTKGAVSYLNSPPPS